MIFILFDKMGVDLLVNYAYFQRVFPAINL